MIIGAAGHIDHGKTALVKALTGVDADRLKEEKERGITIDLGYAYAPSGKDRILGFIDVPGHERFIHNMLAGVTGIDFVLLVVAADDGPMPQTIEHLNIVSLLGLRRGAVALTKIDRVANYAPICEKIRDLLVGKSLEGAPIFPVSAISGQGIAALRTHLDLIAGQSSNENQTGYFRLAIDRCFNLTGAGVIVTGTIFSGCVRVGEHFVISPENLEVKVRGLRAQNREARIATAGQRCALNLTGKGVHRERIHRGDWVIDANAHAPTSRFDAELEILASEIRPIKHWSPCHVHLACSDTMGRIALLESDELKPGERALAQIVVDQPLCGLRGDRFIVRDQSATRTVGGGMILDPFAPARRRRTPTRLNILNGLRQSTVLASLKNLTTVPNQFLDLKKFSLSWNLRIEELLDVCKHAETKLIETDNKLFGCNKTMWAKWCDATLKTLTQLQNQNPQLNGIAIENLYESAVRELPYAIFLAVVDDLVIKSNIEKNGTLLRTRDHRAVLSRSDESLWRLIAPLLENSPSRPPRVPEIAMAVGREVSEVRKVLDQLVSMGSLHRVSNDHYFIQEVVLDLASAVRKTGKQYGKFTAAQYRDLIHTGRKAAIEILEFFDRNGLTLRHGDLRSVRTNSEVFRENGKHDEARAEQ